MLTVRALKKTHLYEHTVNYVAAVLEAYLKPGKYGGLTANFDAKDTGKYTGTM